MEGAVELENLAASGLAFAAKSWSNLARSQIPSSLNLAPLRAFPQIALSVSRLNIVGMIISLASS